MKSGVISAGLLSLTLLPQCSKERPDVLRDFPPPRPITELPERNRTAAYELDSNSTLTVTLRFGKERVDLVAPARGGHLQLVPEHLSGSNASVWFRLEDLSVRSSSATPSLIAAATKWIHGLTTDPSGSGEVRVQLERLLEMTSDSATQAPAKRGSAEVRRTEVRGTARTRLTLHSVRTEQNVRLRLEFEFPGSKPGQAPESVQVHTVRPHRLNLGAHHLEMIAQPEVPPTRTHTSEQAGIAKLDGTANVDIDLFWRRQRVASHPAQP